MARNRFIVFVGVLSVILSACTRSQDARSHYEQGRACVAARQPADAMRHFVAASECRTTDYRLLGRVHSNIATICHAAEEYSLSFEQFAVSAEYFLRAGDSLLYWYDLNNMAFETAAQADTTATRILLDSIRRSCAFSDVLTKTYETEAYMHNKVAHYAEAVRCVRRLHALGNHEPTGYVNIARAFAYLDQNDSAVLYARHVMQMSDASYGDRYNMLYILVNRQAGLSADSIRQLAALRNDIRTQHLIPLAEQNALAVEILRQAQSSLASETETVLLAVCIALLVLVLIFFAVLRYRWHKQHTQAQQQATAERRRQVEDTCRALQQSENWLDEIGWKDYDTLRRTVNRHFRLLADKLKMRYALSEREMRLCVLVLMGCFTDKQMADILCYGEKSIRTIKRNTAIKMGTTSRELRTFLIDMIDNS